MQIGPQRPVNPDAIVAPQGYRVEALITGLTFPSAISFGPGGEIYLAEAGGVTCAVVAQPRVLRIDPDRSINEIGRLDNPIVGLVYRSGELLIAEDGPAPRILRVTAEGEVKVLVEGLPGGGDYGLSGLILDASGALLFGLGTRTNSGVVGLDNVARGWVEERPEWADVPGADIELSGVNYVTADPGLPGSARAISGSFKAFGFRCEPGEKLRGSALCSGAVYRLSLDAAEPERLAWGLRSPVGLACSPEGRILATEGGMEERGSRPVAGAPDNVWEIRPGSYYGWPDYASGIPVAEPRFRLPGHPPVRRLLNGNPQVAGAPVVTFAPRSGVGRVDFSTSAAFGFAGDFFVALSGAWTGPAYAGENTPWEGHRVVRVDARTGSTTDFMVNRQTAPSSAGNSGGLERPFDVRFDPTGDVMYIVDRGEVQLSREYGLEPFGGTGVVWRVTRIRPLLLVPGTLEAAGTREDEPGGEIEPGDEPAEETLADDAEEAAGVGEAEPGESQEEAPAAFEAIANDDTTAADAPLAVEGGVVDEPGAQLAEEAASAGMEAFAGDAARAAAEDAPPAEEPDTPDAGGPIAPPEGDAADVPGDESPGPAAAEPGEAFPGSDPTSPDTEA
jgi:glucose/arabinose dehydrogenase